MWLPALLHSRLLFSNSRPAMPERREALAARKAAADCLTHACIKSMALLAFGDAEHEPLPSDMKELLLQIDEKTKPD